MELRVLQNACWNWQILKCIKNRRTHVKKRLHHVPTPFGLCVGVQQLRTLYFSYKCVLFSLRFNCTVIFAFLELRWTWSEGDLSIVTEKFGSPSCIFHFRERNERENRTVTQKVWVNERERTMLLELKFIFLWSTVSFYFEIRVTNLFHRAQSFTYPENLPHIK